MARFLTFCLLLTSSAAFAQFRDGMSEFLFELELRHKLQQELKPRKHRKKKAKTEDPQARCQEVYLEMKDIYERKVKLEGKNFLHEGMMDKAFTREEIETMGRRLRHGSRQKVRGTDKVLKRGYSYGHVPPFPHTRPGCEHAFREEVAIVDAADKKCRQIKFSLEGQQESVYYQIYCQDSPKLFMSFGPETDINLKDAFPPTDCVHCQK